MARRGLYANIHAKRKRIKAGSGEKMLLENLRKQPKKGLLEGKKGKNA